MIAFALVHRRLRGPDQGLGVAVLLRSTELARAAALTCALEQLRRADPARLGAVRFSVGLWSGARPLAEVADEIVEYKGSTARDVRSPFPLTECPWCRRPLDRDSLVLEPSRARPEEVVVSCLDTRCAYSTGTNRDGLPVVFVDEQVRRERPPLLLAATDELEPLFGRVARSGRRPLLDGVLPPELIVRDEPGPDDAALVALCTDPDGARPKILASTVREEQAEALFPPPGIDADDTWFAEPDPASPGRLHLGVAARGRSMQALQARTSTLDRPGLVATCFDTSDPRDRSAYERFAARHAALDVARSPPDEGEPTSLRVVPKALGSPSRGQIGVSRAGSAPGSLVDLVDGSALVGGLDFWDPGVEVLEPRLRAAVDEQLRRAGRPTLSPETAFRGPSSGIQALEFPAWFVCQNPECRGLLRSRDGLVRKGPRYTHSCTPKGADCAPVRWVATCRRGHLEDVPWIAFAHREARPCAVPQLSLLEGDPGEIEVRCACGARASLAPAPDALPRCAGKRPWLGPDGDTDCDQRLVLLSRSARDAYFPQVASALSIPERSGGEGLRSAEYEALLASSARRYHPPGGLPSGVGAIVLVPELREVRALVGFTRLEPAPPDLEGQHDLGAPSSPLSLRQGWLPAVEVRGEGVLVSLDEAAVAAWEDRPAVRARARELQGGHGAWNERNERGVEFPGVRFYLLHSLSHLLITAISLERGYAAGAIRERIYCAPRGAPSPMAAVLLSAGTPGLLAEGRRLRRHLQRAWDLGVLCSNDPVCADHVPREGPGERLLEGAACPGCLFVAEPCCERSNRFLDRALVAPIFGHDPELAFWGWR